MKSLFDNVLDFIGQPSLYLLSTAWARDSIAVVQLLSNPVIRSRSRQSRVCRRLVMVLIQSAMVMFTIMKCTRNKVHIFLVVFIYNMQ